MIYILAIPLLVLFHIIFASIMLLGLRVTQVIRIWAES